MHLKTHELFHFTIFHRVIVKKSDKIEKNIKKQQKKHFDPIVYYLVMPISILVVGRLCWYVISALCLHFIYQIYDNKSMQ